MSSEPEISADAAGYVRACDDVVALGINPIWIPMVVASIFFQSVVLAIFTVVVMIFLFVAKRNGARPFDLVRRVRRRIVGAKRLPYRGY